MKHLRLLVALLALLTGVDNLAAQTWSGNEIAQGDFYLFNVGAQKYLNNGDPNESWGSNAYLQTGFGMDVTLTMISDGVYTIDTKVSNGGDSHYLASSTWTDGNATNWTFRAVDDETNVYQIIYDGQYLMANEALNDVEMLGDPGSRVTSTYWKLVSENDFKAAMQAKGYSATDPMDVSVFIKGRSFARNDTRNSSWTTTHNGGNWTWIGSSENKYFGNEAWNNTFDVHQDITDLPDGTYEVRCSGFGTNGTTYIYGNSKQGLLQTDNTTSYGNSKEAKWKAIHEDNAFAGQTTGTFTLSGGNLTVGIKRETNTGGDWCVYDEFRLYYYGLDLSEFAATLAAAVTAAEAVEGTVPNAAYQALAAVVAENNKTYSTAAEYTTATNAIVEATNTAKALQPNYTRYINVRDAVLAINNNIDVSEANSQAEAATTIEDLDAAVQTVRTALTNYLSTASLGEGETIDLTDALIDNAAPGISGTTDYWTNSESPSLQYQLYEYYQKSGATTKQAIASTLPAGNYKLTAVAFTRSSYEAKLNAGENSTNIATVGSDVVNNREQGNTWITNGNGVTNLVFNLAEPTANLEIGLTAATEGDQWMCWRSFRLVYGDVFEHYTLVEGKMNADVAAAQTAAESAYKNNPSPATYQALMNAIANAQASAKAYEDMTTAVTKIDAALEAATSATASAEAYNTIKSAYNEGTIADADIMTKVAAAYDAVIPVIKSQTAAQADFTLAIQNQSFEYGDMTGWTAASSSDTGVREASNATYSATGSDGKYLFNTWWQGVPLTQAVADLPNGEYTLTVSVASDGATIYLLANGEHNEGIETYATTNAEQGQYSKDTFQDATFTFLVKDGNATIGVVGGADGTAGEHKDYVEAGYWWYKADNFRLVKNRELTEEEMAVIPTGITLDKTEVTLTATENTVTLTPTFNPENATTTVTWTTSDANIATVADGVVTGVAPGTATITVASTLNADVKATCTVTVSYPESVVPETSYENDGATRTVYTLGENLIKNGVFEYPDAFYSWTSSNDFKSKITSDNFTIKTDNDGQKYLVGTKNTGAAGVGSLGTAWKLEQGKTYQFAYDVKKEGNGTDFTYIKTSLVSSPSGDESKTTSRILGYPSSINSTWTTITYNFTAGENENYLQVSFRWLNNQWGFRNFRLTEVSTTTEGNVDYVKDAIPTANIGENAFQYSQEAIDVANDLVQGEATVEDVTNAYNAVTTVNAPAEGQLFNVVLTYDGWTYDNKAMTYIANGRTDGGNYNIQYKEEANQNLAQAFTFTKVEGNNYKMSQIDADGVARYISTGQPYGGNASQIRTTTNADDALVVTVIPTATESKWNLRNTAANQYIGSQDAGVYTVNSHIDFKLVETSKPSITINTTAAGWGTTILPFAVNEIPEGVKIYSCTEANNGQLTLVEEEVLEANKPYIIEGAWKEETLTGDAQGTALKNTEGLLTGTYVNMTKQELHGNYIMQKHGDKVGFFKVDGTGTANPSLGANRVYLTVPEDTEVKAFYLGENTNGINAIESLASGNAEIFNINGVKQNSLQKGVNIIKTEDGKTHKIMVK